MCWPRKRSRSGERVTSASSSPTRSAWRPRARSASIRSSSAEKPNLLEAGGFGLRERLRELGQGRTTPERKRLAQQSGGVLGSTLRQRLPPPREQLLETVEVELSLADLDHVTGRARQQPLRGKQLTQP